MKGHLDSRMDVEDFQTQHRLPCWVPAELRKCFYVERSRDRAVPLTRSR